MSISGQLLIWLFPCRLPRVWIAIAGLQITDKCVSVAGRAHALAMIMLFDFSCETSGNEQEKTEKAGA